MRARGSRACRSEYRIDFFTCLEAEFLNILRSLSTIESKFATRPQGTDRIMREKDREREREKMLRANESDCRNYSISNIVARCRQLDGCHYVYVLILKVFIIVS